MRMSAVKEKRPAASIYDLPSDAKQATRSISSCSPNPIVRPAGVTETGLVSRDTIVDFGTHVSAPQNHRACAGATHRAVEDTIGKRASRRSGMMTDAQANLARRL